VTGRAAADGADDGDDARDDGRESRIDPASLPDPIARRLAALTVTTVNGMPDQLVPAALRFARTWHPARLPTAGRQRILAVVLGDESVRQRLAGHLVQVSGEAEAVAGGERPGLLAQDEAALLVLLRPDPWRPRFGELVQASAPARPGEDPQWQRRIHSLEARLARQQDRAAKDVLQARQEAAAERDRLASENARLRDQVQQHSAALSDAERALSESEGESARLAREVRRLRARLAAATSEAGQRRSGDRTARAAASARVQVLLQVLQDAAAGLAEELEPAGEVSAPADLVPADAPAQPVAALRIVDEAELAAALRLPRCHLIVDGYNITKGVWGSAPLQTQRDRLVVQLAALAARTGAEVTVVFDGALVGPVPAVAGGRGVRVRFSEPGQIADRLIVRLVQAEPRGRPLVVASSDRALGSGARSAGARTCDREVLLPLLAIAR
jgi:hypothetical protein